MNRLLSATLILALIIIFSQTIETQHTQAQISCFFYPVGPALTDLGANTYSKLKPVFNADPSTWTYELQPGVIGGLYSNGLNVRPAMHDVAGVSLANQIQPLDNAGNPAPNGKIGLISVGMSNTQMEFGRFKTIADADSELNDQLVIVNGALSGGTVEKWTNPADPQYQNYWNNFNTQIAQNGLTHSQIQVAWVKITQLGSNGSNDFPSKMHLLESRLELLAKELKIRLPNLKITYFSSRTRSFSYMPNQLAEPGAFENGFAVRWLIERQINGDPNLNYDPANGSTTVSYMAWGPYLWIDGIIPRFDGRTWPLTNINPYDCVHPTIDGEQAVAEMLIEFFKTDTTATPWFLNTPPAPDVTPPSVSITNPTDNSYIAGLIDVIANALDNIGIGGVQFLLNGTSLGNEDTVSPYSIVFDTTSVSNGPYSLFAIARDLAGNFATSTGINVNLNNFVDTTPPSVLMGFPPPDNILSGTAVIQAETSDNVGVVGVQFLLNGANLGTEDTTFPYSISWDTLTVPNGVYALSARARDSAGNTSIAEEISVIVENLADTTPPVISGILASNISQNSVDISWTTDEPADTQVEFSAPCPSSGCLTPLVGTLVTAHNVSVTGFAPNSTYTYRVRSADTESNLSISSDQTFDTLISPLSSTPISAWGFATNSVTDDLNPCTGCSNTNATWISNGIVSGAFDFNGTDAYLNLGGFPYLNNKTEMTLSLWIKPDFSPTSTTRRYVFNDGINFSLFYLDATRHWRMTIRTTTDRYFIDTPTTTWTSGTWHHFAATYDGSALKLYWDGVQKASAFFSGTIEAESGATYLGRSIVTGNYFDGSLDELRIYDYVLSDEEVTQLFQNPGL